jgi:hypothetical protein
MSNLSRLIAAATLIGATALAPSLAAADDRRDQDRYDGRPEHGHLHDASPGHVHDRRCGHDPRLQAPAWAYRDDLRWDGRAWVRTGWQRHELGQSRAQARAVRLELAELDRDRAAFHARFGHNHRKVARYDARYFDRREDLERELQRLTWYAWR